MAVQGSMDQDIAGGRTYAAGIARLLETARQHYGCVRAQMPMARQAKAARQKVHAGFDLAKLRIVDGWWHVQSIGEDDIAGKNNLLRRSSVKSNGFKTACLGWLILESFAGFNVRDSERRVVML
jgi:hypothetical protein